VSGAEWAAILTAVSVVLGTLYSIYNTRRKDSSADASNLWQEAMNLVRELRAENTRLANENRQLRERVAELENIERYKRTQQPPPRRRGP
jgi:regulator of replication initiation timing